MSAPPIPTLHLSLVPDERLRPALDAAPRLLFSDVGGGPAGGPPSRVAVAASARTLAVLFEVDAEPPLRVAAPDGGAVYEDECVEIFVGDPRDPASYREVVVSPAAARYGAEVRNPDESRATWTLRPGRLPAGLDVEVSGDPADRLPSDWHRWRCRIELPWRSLSTSGISPSSGSERRLNAFRIARGRTTRYHALSPTLRTSPPDFHVPSRFARLLFAGPPAFARPAC